MKSILPMPLLTAMMFAVILPTAAIIAQDESAEEKATHDVRIKKLLDQTELNFEIDGDGDFKLLFEYDDGRSHIVFINSKTETYQGMEIREVWAVGYVPPDNAGTVPSDVGDNLIRANAATKLGAWQIQKMGDKEVGVFRAMIAAEANKEIVLDTLRLVGISADEKEAELLKTDDLTP